MVNKCTSGCGLFTFALLPAIVNPGSWAWDHWKEGMIRACFGN